MTAQSNVFVCADNSSEPLQLENISTNETDSQSLYKDQVDFITAYLKNYYVYLPTSNESLESNFANSTENGSLSSNASAEIILFLKSGNTSDITNHNTSMLTNAVKNSSGVVGVGVNESLASLNLSSNSVPLFYSLAVDTLPVHPRIPRTPPKRRKPYQNNRRYQQQRHRHSTRVILTKPTKFLLPPSDNKSVAIIEANTNSRSDFSQNSPYTTTTFKQEPQQTPTTEINFKISDSGRRRTIFFPPPKRYLLPPFVDTNNIINYSSTTVAYFESSSTEYSGSYYDTLPTTKEYSQQTYQYKPEENNNNQNIEVQFGSNTTNSESPEQKQDDIYLTTYDWNTTENYPKEFLQNRSEFYSSHYPDTLTTVNNEKLWNLTSPAVQTTENYPSIYTENKSDIYVTVSTKKYDKYWNSTSFRPKSKTYNYNNHQRKTTATQEPFQQYTPTTLSFPVITGRNVEQELFETGEFPAFVTADDTVPSTTPSFQDNQLSMMNKPLLSSDVASSGMKIVANVPSTGLPENKADSVENLARGRQRFGHLNQFKFQHSKNDNNKFIPRRKETPLKQSSQNRGLSVAETAYYRKRKISNQPRSQQENGGE